MPPAEPEPIRLKIIVNEEPHLVAPQTTLAELLKQLQIPTRGVAVELNEQIVPRGEHATRLLQAGDKLEVVSFVGGG